MKTGEGALAPKLWKEGKLGSVIDYCLNDVTQERALFEHMVKNKTVASAYKTTPYAIKLPAVLDQ